MHPDALAISLSAGAVVVARPRRGRHSTAKRLQFSKLALLIAISVLGSTAVALVAPWLMPPEALDTMADPTFDVDAFYKTHQNAINREIAYAFTPGLPSVPKPIAGLNQAQTVNAFIIIEVGKQMRLPKRAYVVAIATALQESNLRNVANEDVPASLRLPHEGVASNYDSLGLFQQRPSMGWGTPAQLMDPAQASSRFYAKLVKINGWPNMSITAAAQAVQRSGFPGAYAKHSERAQTIVDVMPSYS